MLIGAMFGMLSVLAELQRELIVANANDGLAAARTRGRVGGRRANLTPDQAALAQQLYDAREKTVQQIADRFGVLRRSTVYGHLDKTKTVSRQPNKTAATKPRPLLYGWVREWDAQAAARTLGLQSFAWLYDVPAHGLGEIGRRFQAVADEHGLAAELVEEPVRVPHRVRAQRVADHGGGDFIVDGVWTVAVPVAAQGALPVTRDRAGLRRCRGPAVGDRRDPDPGGPCCGNARGGGRRG